MKHTYHRLVHFADTDAAGVVHFSKLLCYTEEAEHDFLVKAGIPLLGDGGWPRVHVDCDFVSPLRLADVAEITIAPDKIGVSSITWAFSVSCNERPVAIGLTKCVRIDDDGNPVDLAPSWRQALTQ